MNDEMYAHPQTQANLEAAARRAAWLSWARRSAPLAEGPSERPGRMSEPETILAHAARVAPRHGPAARPAGGGDRGADARVDRSGAGRDQPLERQDGVPRGRGGVGAGRRRRAHLRARSRCRPPIGVTVRRVETHRGAGGRRCARSCPGADVLVMAAAPADFRPSDPSDSKRAAERRRPGDSRWSRRATSSSATRGARKPGSVIVGFALETGDALAKGRAKLERKDLDLIVVNDALEPGAGFEVDTNRVALLGRDGAPQILPLQSKREVAEAILDAVEQQPWPMSGRRYLAQQIELGGAESRSVGASRPGAERSEESGGSASAGDPTTVGGPTVACRRRRSSTAPASQPRWKKGAPPIPGPGLAVASPAPVLLGNDLGCAGHARGGGRADPHHATAARSVPTGPTRCRARAIRRRGWCWSARARAPPRTRTGRPFVGQAGQLLDAILEAIEVPRTSVYITNIVKCRPPQNRKPLPDEIAACIPYLHRQLELIAAEGDPRAGRHGRRGDARREEESGRAARQGAHVQRHSAGRDVPSRGAAPQPELEEADLG